jgi:hypothetical protein
LVSSEMSNNRFLFHVRKRAYPKGEYHEEKRSATSS